MEEKMSAAERFLLLSIAIAAVMLAIALITVFKNDNKKYSREGYEIKEYYDKDMDMNYYIYEDKLGDVVKVEAK